MNKLEKKKTQTNPHHTGFSKGHQGKRTGETDGEGNPPWHFHGLHDVPDGPNCRLPRANPVDETATEDLTTVNLQMHGLEREITNTNQSEEKL